MGPVRLGRRIGVCELTIRRRAKLLAERELIVRDIRRFYSITMKGLEAIGESARPKPWVRPEIVSAALSREVQERGGKDVIDDRTSKQRSAHVRGAQAGDREKARKAVSMRWRGVAAGAGESLAAPR